MDRFQNYFEYNGKRYGTGTIIVVRDGNEERESIFICYDKSIERYRCRFRDQLPKNTGAKQFHGYCRSENNFYESIIAVLDEVDLTVKCPIAYSKRDSEIEGMIDGWICYIVFMAVSIIFKPLLGWWLLWSYIFFNWRKNKIKKAGVHIDW